MKRLVILSDINGQFMPDTQSISKQFDVVDQLDSASLARIDEGTTQAIRHEEFKAGGIDAAAVHLVERYPDGITFALGLSIGGVILWRAAQHGLSIGKLICLSSTRLRFEKLKPDCNTRLYYGQLDPYRPDERWFSDLNVQMNLIPNEDHEFYRTSIGTEIAQRELGPDLLI